MNHSYFYQDMDALRAAARETVSSESKTNTGGSQRIRNGDEADEVSGRRKSVLRVIMVVLLLSIAVSCVMFVQSNASGRSVEPSNNTAIAGLEAHGGQLKQAVEAEYIIAAYGDTIWSIARRFKPVNDDLRQYVYRIQQLNELTHGELQVGQVIRIPD